MGYLYFVTVATHVAAVSEVSGSGRRVMVRAEVDDSRHEERVDAVVPRRHTLRILL